MVVFHSAVLAYVSRAGRAGFARTVRGLGVTWLANEAPGVLPALPAPPADAHGFLLAENGRAVIAVTDSHGTWVEWIG